MSTLTAIGRNLSPIERAAIKQVVSDAQKSFGTIFAEASKADPENPALFHAGTKESGVTVHLGDLSEANIRELGKLKDATIKLESVLMAKVLEAMEKTVPKSEFDGPMGQMSKDMFRETFSQELAKKSGMGLSESLFRQLSRTFLGQQAATLLRANATQATPALETPNDKNP